VPLQLLSIQQDLYAEGVRVGGVVQIGVDNDIDDIDSRIDIRSIVDKRVVEEGPTKSARPVGVLAKPIEELVIDVYTADASVGGPGGEIQQQLAVCFFGKRIGDQLQLCRYRVSPSAVRRRSPVLS